MWRPFPGGRRVRRGDVVTVARDTVQRGNATNMHSEYVFGWLFIKRSRERRLDPMCTTRTRADWQASCVEE